MVHVGEEESVSVMMTHIHVQSKKINTEEIWFKCNFEKSNIQWQVLKVLGPTRLTLKGLNQVALRSYDTEILLHKGNQIESSHVLSAINLYPICKVEVKLSLKLN